MRSLYNIAAGNHDQGIKKTITLGNFRFSRKSATGSQCCIAGLLYDFYHYRPSGHKSVPCPPVPHAVASHIVATIPHEADGLTPVL
ncbi:hypothetical protein [Komagataeibacter sp. FNDCF1]|uniref:hypothetical protein n=1 Tax=Komagataeibacter sp. FNDCF1 TaxID=2878681 RepID=UPI001E3A58D1|nr:hypothetical protein [Komagataeibacter sp. FNDCF1]MCE2564058.1 hypothetical protein [Komagataeibacter sp. FNDCF1]